MKKTPFPHLTFLWGLALFAGPSFALSPQAQQDAYSLGMGQADSAVVGGTHAISLNPAGVARANEPMAQLGLGTQGPDLFLNTSVLYPMTDGTVFALSQFSDFPNQPFSRTTYIGTVAMPLNTARDLFFGLNLKVLSLSDLNGANVMPGSGLGLDLGIAYDLRRPEGTIASFALAIQDLSTEVRFGNSYDLTLPRTFLLGVAYQNIPDTRVEADFQIVDQTLQNTPLHNRLRFGVEHFFEERQFSGRIGYDDPFDADGYFTLGAGYHPAQPFEVTLALTAAPQSGDIGLFSSLVYRFGELFKPTGTVPGSRTEASSTITLGPSEDLTRGATQVGKPISGVPLRKMSIEVDPKVFSPAGRQKTTWVKFPGKTGPGVARWVVLIQGQDERPLRELGGTGSLLPGFLWDGTDDSGQPVPEGRYSIVLRTFNEKNEMLSDDSQTVDILLPRSKFEIALDDPYFSPLLKKRGKKELTLSVNAGGSAAVQGWDFEISDSSTQKVVHQQQGKGKLPKSLKWNGKDLNNHAAQDGKYMALLTAQDLAGNNLKSDALQFTLDSTPPEVALKAENTWLAPSDKTPQKYTLDVADLSGVENWTLVLSDEDDRVVKDFHGSGQPPESETWDGTDANGQTVKPGALVSAVLEATDKAGNKGESDPVEFQVDYRPPSNQEQLTLNLTTLYFNAQSSQLTDYARKDMDKAAGSIKEYMNKSLLVVKGYASSSETGDLLTLSHARAVEVKKYLVKNLGVPESAVFAVGYADKDSTKKGTTPLSEDPDRRVVISLTTLH
ncbi:MAG TPA: OmpA family protein [bacterium]|nr:OmpA family protein [bacterium]